MENLKLKLCAFHHMPGYRRYLAQRVATYVTVILVALLINFMIPRLIPGDPIKGILEDMSRQGSVIGKEGEEIVKQYREKFGLDGPVQVQFISYLAELVKGNLGYSIIFFPTTVIELIARGMPWTLCLLAVTTITSWLLGNLVGAVAGWRGGKLSYLAPISMFLGNIPFYLLAIIMVYFFAFVIPMFPSMGGYSRGMVPTLSLAFIQDAIWHSILPAFSIIVSSLGWWFLSMRSMMMTVKDEDFIFMAEAKGLKERYIMWKYAFRNAILPQVTGLAISLGRVLGGAVLTEIVFNYPGIGSLLYSSIYNMDYPLIQGCVLLLILTMCSVNLAVDLLYPFLDPRIRYGES